MGTGQSDRRARGPGVVCLARAWRRRPEGLSPDGAKRAVSGGPGSRGQEGKRGEGASPRCPPPGLALCSGAGGVATTGPAARLAECARGPAASGLLPSQQAPA